jgi:hypothetical protein
MKSAMAIEIEGRRIATYRGPRDGAYTEGHALSRDAAVAPAACPGLALPVVQIVG